MISDEEIIIKRGETNLLANLDEAIGVCITTRGARETISQETLMQEMNYLQQLLKDAKRSYLSFRTKVIKKSKQEERDRLLGTKSCNSLGDMRTRIVIIKGMRRDLLDEQRELQRDLNKYELKKLKSPEGDKGVDKK